MVRGPRAAVKVSNELPPRYATGRLKNIKSTSNPASSLWYTLDDTSFQPSAPSWFSAPSTSCAPYSSPRPRVMNCAVVY